ncbi:F-box protein At3g07870-like [Lycium barbarum]|uniref:F-box protein At3g07870-like n=1 Tax=Lycium barbarum TaxID=112863 RepID=UPI00293E3BAF|nr:F-box protein At3g07870-like [Lycium barbarum]
MDTQAKKQNCQADEAPSRYGFDRLSEEFVLDIVSRLPITSLLQFTFGRKSFYNLSHDPELVNLHLSRAVKTDPCIIFHKPNQLYFLEFSDHGTEEAVMRKISNSFANSTLVFEVIGSCHGLLCIWDCLISDSLYVYNPFTRDYKELPISVEPHVQELVFWFGFHPITKEYKLIKIKNYPICISDAEVLTFGGNRWRSIGKVGYRIDSSAKAIMLNGKMHWLTLFGMYYGRSDRLVVSFDLAYEVFGEVPKIDFGVDPRIVQFQLAVLGGWLAVALISHRFNEGGLEIWVMREYNVKESWVKEFKIGAYTPTPNSVLQYVQPFVKVVCLLKNGKLLLECKGGYMVLYDPQNGVFRTLRMIMKKDLRIYFPLAIHPEMLTWCSSESVYFYLVKPESSQFKVADVNIEWIHRDDFADQTIQAYRCQNNAKTKTFVKEKFERSEYVAIPDKFSGATCGLQIQDNSSKPENLFDHRPGFLNL